LERFESKHTRPTAVATPPARKPRLRQAYLTCLERLARIRFQQERGLNDQGIRLLDRTIFAAFCECRDAGAAGEAMDILHRVRQAAASEKAA
jgi:hypothetical protein